MNIWQQREQRSKNTRKVIKKCEAAQNQIKFGFEPPLVNSIGQCSGCRNPDDGELESQCRGCQHNEYHVEEVGA